ncbi:MAG: hypothetical protein Q8P12_08010, partial [bacterium]|nr:hypothetical protein [bacterium]
PQTLEAQQTQLVFTMASNGLQVGGHVVCWLLRSGVAGVGRVFTYAGGAGGVRGIARMSAIV